MRIFLLLLCLLFFAKAYSQHYTDYLNAERNKYEPLRKEPYVDDDDGLYQYLLRVRISDSVLYKKMAVCLVENGNYHTESTRFKPDTIRTEMYYFDTVSYQLIRHEINSVHGYVIRTFENTLPRNVDAFINRQLDHSQIYYHTGTRLDSVQTIDKRGTTTLFFGANYKTAQMNSGVKTITHQFNDSSFCVLRYSPGNELPGDFAMENSYPSSRTITQTLLRPRVGFSTERIKATTDTVQHINVRLDTAGNVVYSYTKSFINGAVFEYYFFYDKDNKLIRVKNNYNRLHYYYTYEGKQLVRVEMKDFDNIQHCIHLFNKQGFCISKKCIDSDEKIVYTYDEKGNWIVQKRYSSGKLFDIVTRKITY